MLSATNDNIHLLRRPTPFIDVENIAIRSTCIQGSSSASLKSYKCRIQVTNKVSALAQFRTINYGMESRLVWPFLLSVNRLESRIPINTKSISYANKPGLVSTLAQIRVDPGSTKEEVHWLGDGADDFWVEWWQNREGKDPWSAIYVKQHSTV
ncbi:hypothetical protein DFS33DRAFT_1450166 [Desarmillaria ectypa]|nr:hypothetical protein DFS33DRAFT_1450166 [Desarmillaria ectypa]